MMEHHYIIKYKTPEEPNLERIRAIRNIGDLVNKNEGTIVTLPETAFTGISEKQGYTTCALTTKKPVTLEDYAGLKDTFKMIGGEVKIIETKPMPMPYETRE